jgi:hypothetical protein
MAFTVVADGAEVIDNYLGDLPFDWLSIITRDHIIDQGAWFSTGQLQLQLQIFYSVVTNPLIATPGSSRYLNPTQSAYGHWAAESDGFVLADGRLKYERQMHTFNSAQIQISNTGQDAPRVFGLTTNTQAGHAQQVAELAVCGTIRGLLPPPPTPTALDFSATIGKGSICLKTYPGATELREKDPFLITPKLIEFDLFTLALPTALRGVVWAGVKLEIGWLLGYHQEASTAQATLPEPFIVGDVQPALYSYSCQVGVSVPVPGSCSPGNNIVVIKDRNTGRVSLACRPGTQA